MIEKVDKAKGGEDVKFHGFSPSFLGGSAIPAFRQQSNLRF